MYVDQVFIMDMANVRFSHKHLCLCKMKTPAAMLPCHKLVNCCTQHMAINYSITVSQVWR